MRYKELVPIVNQILSQYDFALTVRQIYYRLISDPYNLFPNTRSSYNGFDKILVRAREREDVDYKQIEDRTRQTIGEDKGWDSPQSYWSAVLRYFERSWEEYDKEMWIHQETIVEVWVEKDALAQIVSQATTPYKVLIFPSRGFSSYTKVKEAIERLEERCHLNDSDSKNAVILHLADHDPSGISMTSDLSNRFANYGADFISVQRIALNIDLARSLKLRPNPVKFADSRSPAYVSQFGQDCWELDAIPPDKLESIITDSIEGFVDFDIWNETTEQIDTDRRFLSAQTDQVMALLRKNKLV